MDTVNYFVAETDLPLQDNDKGYGPMSSLEYRVTSIFGSNSDIMAYAVTDDVFIVEQKNNSDRVNLFLNPTSISIVVFFQSKNKMDISGLSSITTSSEMLTWLAQNCLTPINPDLIWVPFRKISSVLHPARTVMLNF